MNRRLLSRVTHRLDPRRLPAGTIVHGAQIAVLAIGALATHDYLGGGMGDSDAGRIALILGVAVLIAAPQQRGAELLGAVAIWLTTCEFMAASRTGQFALWRWVMGLAALALVLILTRVSHFRAQARANPWRRLGDGDWRRPRSGPGAAWRRRARAGAADQVPPAQADIEGQARLLATSPRRSR
jgi:hypothetical protein